MIFAPLFFSALAIAVAGTIADAALCGRAFDGIRQADRDFQWRRREDRR